MFCTEVTLIGPLKSWPVMCCYAQDAIDKGAFKTRGTIHEGSPNMINITRTATEIAGAMTYLHSLDILHADLNGNNILLISNTGIDDRPFSVKARTLVPPQAPPPPPPSLIPFSLSNPLPLYSLLCLVSLTSPWVCSLS